MRYIFKKLFEFSIDMPFDLFDDFKSFTICDEDKMIEANPNLKKELANTSMQFFDFTQFQHKIHYEDLYEDWFIEQVFG